MCEFRFSCVIWFRNSVSLFLFVFLRFLDSNQLSDSVRFFFTFQSILFWDFFSQILKSRVHHFDFYRISFHYAILFHFPNSFSLDQNPFYESISHLIRACLCFYCQNSVFITIFFSHFHAFKVFVEMLHWKHIDDCAQFDSVAGNSSICYEFQIVERLIRIGSTSVRYWLL